MTLALSLTVRGLPQAQYHVSKQCNMGENPIQFVQN